MTEEKKQVWMSWLALTTIIFAVCATLATFKGGGYSTRSVLSQAQASDQWAYFQAKSTKQTLVKLQTEQMKLAQMAVTQNPQLQAAYQAKIDEYEAKASKYETEKAQVETEARRLETVRDDAQRHGKPFGLAVIFLQLAILVSGIAGLFKRKELWWLALPIGAAGLVLFADGFLLLF